MIRECEDHGYFRDEHCPICGEEGKFIMSDYEVEKMGRTMAGILRHGKFDLEMDEQGFVDIRDIIAVIKDHNPRMKWLRIHHVEALVETDPKGRYQISGACVRATYGHTIKLNLNLPTDNIPYTLYYPATSEECDIILEVGLLPSDRAMVHLSRSYRDAVRAGSVRVEDPVILAVDTFGCAEAGYKIGRAAKTVFLCDNVPPEFLSKAEEEDEDEDEYMDQEE
ncbi:MAG: RNA 2'-phosphotransferase [Candidatus Methanomethylophilaceae archaeon]|nr:RNA 2'-phosphotransferase [Candidatus Methanomethylophilaceae archaeon]MDD3378374.1 RNA 2'-phosphotransferase [Candidatus Methanomethylophilaceae archaeon]MDY0223878.1 RNA 2'-phosphotransferase [Candidatus Methanomethylophilaceae archaeon]